MKIFNTGDNSTVDVGKSGSLSVRGSGVGDSTRIKLLTQRVEELENELKEHSIVCTCVSNHIAIVVYIH